MNFILQTFKNAMRFFIYGTCLQCFFLTLTFAESLAQHKKLEEISISLSSKEISLEETFSYVEKETGLKFTYIKSRIPLKKKIEIESSHDMMSLLETLANEYKLHFKRVNNQIIVRKAFVKQKIEEIIIVDDRVISGKIKDAETGDPLPGVTVLIAGTTIGTVTSIDGEYRLDVPETAKVLLFSFVGYATKEIEIGNQTQIDVAMELQASELDEIVVIGYGSQSKVKVNGAISSTKSEELQQYSSPNFEQQLSGKLSGVLVNETGGQPGYDAQVIIRGIGTLTAGTYPLVVVDGVPLSEGSTLSSINPNDIEKIDVLKDAASAAIYGSRASNGVILITTKKGNSEKPVISIDAYTGFQQRADKVSYVDAYEAAQYFTEARDYGYVSKDPTNRSIADDRATRIANGASKRQLRLHYLDPYLAGEPGLTNTDWLDEIFDKAMMTNITTSISGKSKNSEYYVSGGYFKQDGIAIGTNLERYTSTLKLKTKLTDYIDFNINLSPSYSKQKDTNSGDWNADPVAVSYTSYPFFSPYKPDGSLNISEQLVANTPEDGALQENPVAYANLVKDEKYLFRTFGNTFLTIKPIKGLEIKALLGGDYRNKFYDYYDPSFLGHYRAPAPDQASTSETNGRIVNFLTEYTANYFNTFGDHEIDALAGYSFQKEQGQSSKVTGTNIPDDNITNVAGASAHSLSTSRYIWTQVSWFGRFQYFYKSKYQLSAAIRRDGSSRFGDDSKWGQFPSVSAGWIVTNESFFPKSAILSYAKLRASWGKTGNNQIGSYDSKALVKSDNYTYGGELAPGFAATTSPNSALSWETSASINLGIDLSFFNTLSLSANYYTINTEGLLLEVPVPEQSGYSYSLQNIGEVKNSGIELELSSTGINLGPVVWNASANFTSNTNEVLALGDGQEEIKKSGNGAAWITKIGGPISEIYSYEIDGIYKTEDEIAQSPHLTGSIPGDYIVKDINNDGIIDELDQTSRGTYAPKFFYGFSSSFSYKNIDFSFSLNGISGRTVYNYDQGVITETGEGFGVPTKYYFDNRYHPENNPNGFFAQPNMGNFSSARKNTRASDIYMQDGDYLRLRSIQIGYALPTNLINRLGLQKLRMYLSANNLFTITDYRGFNMDATTSDILQAGYARNNYPIAQSFIIGTNITLK
ncbi:TonB-dependent receptor [Flammeovirgaceae bacterium SG7u.111]|nr:TonB-dependent receptor [Flammeovirgaceae bacterium SG7u.132]WPO34617.1 TonB-dependent receptor [Flammeovirgaceae bacterium SG7u.111]